MNNGTACDYLSRRSTTNNDISLMWLLPTHHSLLIEYVKHVLRKVALKWLWPSPWRWYIYVVLIEHYKWNENENIVYNVTYDYISSRDSFCCIKIKKILRSLFASVLIWLYYKIFVVAVSKSITVGGCISHLLPIVLHVSCIILNADSSYHFSVSFYTEFLPNKNRGKPALIISVSVLIYNIASKKSCLMIHLSWNHY